MEGCSRLSPRALLCLARRQDPNAFSEFVDRMRPRLDAIVHSTVRSPQLDREDVLQEALVQSFESIENLRADSVPGFLAWFAGIVRHRLGHAARAGKERVRPRRDTALPWTLQIRQGNEVLEFVCEPGVERTDRQESDGLGVAPLGGVLFEPRVAFLIREGFGSTWGTVGLVIDRGTDQGARRVVREARVAVGDRVSA